MLKSLWQAVLDFLFPPRCAGCRCFVEMAGQWCPDCLGKTLQVRRLPLAPDMARLVTGGAWAVGGYDGGLRHLPGADLTITNRLSRPHGIHSGDGVVHEYYSST